MKSFRTIWVLLSMFPVGACGDAVVGDSEEAVTDLQALHAAAKRHLDANGQVWPQMPEAAFASEKKLASFWIKALAPCGATRAHWKHSKDTRDSPMSYIPSGFDAKKGTPYKWDKQPWFMQIGSEGGDPWIIYPDGRISRFKESLREQDPASE